MRCDCRVLNTPPFRCARSAECGERAQAVTRAHHRWTSGVGPLEQKLATFCNLLCDYDRGDTGSGHSSQPARVRPAHELLSLLAHGVASTPTEQFISQHLTELALGRLFKALDGGSPWSSPTTAL